jgi:uncharacterized metal-binding protein
MPSGKVHEVVNIAAITYLSLSDAFPTDCTTTRAIFLMTGIFGTFYLSPDLDTPYSKPRTRWGMFGFAYRAFSHRGILHNPILAPILLTIPLLPLIIITIGLYPERPVYTGAILAANMLQCELHIALDYTKTLL